MVCMQNLSGFVTNSILTFQGPFTSTRLIAHCCMHFSFIFDTACGLPMRMGMKCGGPSMRSPSVRWYYNGIRCDPFPYAGCGGNGNNFASELQCKFACF